MTLGKYLCYGVCFQKALKKKLNLYLNNVMKKIIEKKDRELFHPCTVQL